MVTVQTNKHNGEFLSGFTRSFSRLGHCEEGGEHGAFHSQEMGGSCEISSFPARHGATPIAGWMVYKGPSYESMDDL